MLFDPAAHEPLHDAPWNPDAAQTEIRAIVADAQAARAGEAWWPLHALDAEPGDPEVWYGVYLGAAGVVWALERLAPAPEHAPLARAVLDHYRRAPDFEGPSLWNGESGIALVAWLLDADAALADRLHALAAVPEPDTLELMWGSPGLLALAGTMLERTGEPRWHAAWQTLADHLVRAWDGPFMTQDLYGRRSRYLGPAHGLAGAIAALAPRRGAEILPKVVAALSATAVREGELVNWPADAGDGLVHNDTIRTQWCHGAPGIVASCAALPSDDELDALLLGGGELTWAAGPLAKGAGLCHGTAGNGLAFLGLFARTRDERWLDRARRFAMHAAAQVEAARSRYGRGRHSLWTGDLGTALFLQQCLTGEAGVPTLERW